MRSGPPPPPPPPPPVCPLVENSDLVYQKRGYPQSLTHPRPTECGSRQAIKARPDHPESFQSIRSKWHRPQLDLVCNEVQQVAPVCVTGARPPGLGSGRTPPAMGGSGPLCLPTSSHLGQVVEKLQGHPCHRIILIARRWPNMPWFWDLDHVNPEPPESPQSAQLANSTLQSDPSQKSDKPKSPRNGS